MGGKWSRRVKPRECRCLMLGLDGAGKTTILYRLKPGYSQKTIPTIGFNVESIVYKKLRLNVWDIGGQDNIRSLWKHYIDSIDALIFVIDCNDMDRIDEAISCFNDLIVDLPDIDILIYANKMDLSKHLRISDICGKMNLDLLNNDWHLQTSNALDGTGIYEGLDWLSNKVKKF